jgi:hypothetical protein
MSDPQGRPPTEEEMRAAYEQQLKQLRVQDVVVETLVTLVNLGGRKAGLAPGTEDERDLDQVRTAVEAVRGLLPLVEAELGPNAAQVRNALSQLQMTYAREAAPAPGGPGEPAAERPQGAPQPEGPGPAQTSGRLWVPGQ